MSKPRLEMQTKIEKRSSKKQLFFWIALATVDSSNIYDKGQQKNVIKLTSARK